MTTSADLISETRARLQTGQTEQVNRLNGSITASQTTATFKYALGAIKSGGSVILSIDLELIRVWETTDSSMIAGVIERGVLGSTAAAHADLATVTVMARFSDFAILQALNEDLADLSAPSNGLYQVKTVDITFNPSVAGYNLTSVTDIIGEPFRVLYKTPGPAAYWPEIRSWRYESDMNTAEFASGKAIFLYEGAYPGFVFRVFYRAPFTLLSTTLTTYDVALTGLGSTATDLPPLGAALRLMDGREVKRNFTESQGEPRRAAEVPPGAVGGSSRGLAQRRQSRIMAEAARLAAMYPTKLRVK